MVGPEEWLDQRDFWTTGMPEPERWWAAPEGCISQIHGWDPEGWLEQRDGWNRGMAVSKRWLCYVAVCKRIQWDRNKTKTLSSAVSFDSLASHFGLASYVLFPIPPVFTTDKNI